MDRASVFILSGGLSPERDVSLRSGRRIADCLRNRDFDVEIVDVDDSLAEEISTRKPDCVIPLVHGLAGENGELAALIALLGVPHIGSSAESCRQAFDKPTANDVVSQAGLSVPRFIVLEQQTFRTQDAQDVLRSALSDLGLPLVVKPVQGGSSLGVSVVRTPAELAYAMVNAFAYGDRALLQAYVPGTEVTVGVLQRGEDVQSLPVVQINADGGLYDYQARYTAGATEFTIPADLPDDVLVQCGAAAVAVHAALQLRHWSRCDLIVDEGGRVWFLEVNVAPGMTETSTYPQAIAAAGLEMGEVVANLIHEVLDTR
jgi:D-alanine-D-alanine ligase